MLSDWLDGRNISRRAALLGGMWALVLMGSQHHDASKCWFVSNRNTTGLKHTFKAFTIFCGLKNATQAANAVPLILLNTI